MHFSLSTNSLLFLGLMGICSAAPAAQNGVPVLTRIPPTCIGFSNGEIKTPDCYTATTTTTTVPTSCPKIKCPVPDDPIMCPMIIHITTTAIPCSTDCCPSTPTQTVTKKVCPTCTTGCVIPTYTSTVTTGCKPGGGIVRPTAIATLIVG